MSIEIRGIEEVKARLQRMATRFPNEAARALYEEGSIELKEMKRRTPVDTNALRSSLAIHQPVINGRNISVQIVAGGPTAPYAAIVHEDLHAEHLVGQAKYVSSVLNESKRFMAARIMKRISLNRLLA